MRQPDRREQGERRQFGRAPHWWPPDFMSWPGYDRLWGNLLHWLCGQQ
jgi:uncharacterized membrane protein